MLYSMGMENDLYRLPAPGTSVDVLTYHGDVLIAGAIVTGSFEGMVRMDWPNGEVDKLVRPRYVRESWAACHGPDFYVNGTCKHPIHV